MKSILKRFAKIISNLLLKVLSLESIKKEIQRDLFNSQIQQRHLQLFYQKLLANNGPFPKLSDTGFRVYSQTNEDGILLYIFSLIGTTNKICLDVGPSIKKCTLS